MHVRHSTAVAMALALTFGAPTLSAAQILPRQTAAQRRLAANCYQRSDAHLNNPFRYPLKVGASPDGKSLGVFVVPDKWRALTEPERVVLLRDVACWYAGGRLSPRYWHDLSAVDAEAGRVLETYSGTKLWPGSEYR